MLSCATSLSARELAARLQPKTIESFTRYAAAFDARIERELHENTQKPYLRRRRTKLITVVNSTARDPITRTLASMRVRFTN